jgi:hypothetical protein
MKIIFSSIKYLKFIFMMSLLYSFPTIVRAEIIVYNDEQNIIEQFVKSDTTYLINTIINLKEDTLHIPNNCILKFSNNGKICNGTVIGFNTTITEYLGEFYIILNNFSYNLYKSFNKDKK